MATISQLASTIASELRVGSGDTYRINLIKEVIRTEYALFWDAHYWDFTRRLAFVTTSAPKTTGTVSITTANNTQLLGSGTSFASTDVGSWVWVGAHPTPLMVTGYISATELTVQPYLGTVDLSSVAYRMYRDTYSLPADWGRPEIGVEYEGIDTLNWMSEVHFKSMHPVPDLADVPYDACVVWYSDSDYRMMLYPIPYSARLIPVVYHTAATIPADSDSLGLPPLAEKYLTKKCICECFLRIHRDINLYQSYLPLVEADLQAVIKNYTSRYDKLVFEYPGQRRHDTDYAGVFRTDLRGRKHWGYN